MNFFNALFRRGPLLIMTAAFLWAADGVLRRSLYSISPLRIVFYEHLIGTLLLLPVLFSKRKYFSSFKSSEILNLSFIALFSSLLGTIWFTTALSKVQFISFSVVFLLQKLQPIFVITTAAIVLKERITKEYLRFMCIALVAAYFVTFPNGIVNLATGSETVVAALYALGAAFVWGTSTIFSKIALRTKPDEVVTGMRFLFATIFGFLAIVFFSQVDQLGAITFSQGLRFLMIALSTGMVAMVIYYKGLALVEAKIATLLELLFPLAAVFIDAVVFKSTLAPIQYIAGAVLLYSAYKLSLLRSERLSITSQRIKGKGRGEKMGVPTINFSIPKTLKTREGIYASYITINGQSYKGALHYGPVPAFKQNEKSLEVFLLDSVTLSKKDLSSKDIKVEFVQFIRPVLSFNTTDDLVRQIHLDTQTINRIL